MKNDKLQRLALVAHLYYEQEKTQHEIAEQLGVSRPLISRMLREAKKEGIVEIKIHEPDGDEKLLSRLLAGFHLRGGVLAPETWDDAKMNHLLAELTLELLQSLNIKRLGIGWGEAIGSLVSFLESQRPEHISLRHISPLVGNSGVSIRHYHSDENVRVFSQFTMACPHYLYTPAFAETKQELSLITSTEHYKSVYKQWQHLDCALVNIGNFPSTPDFASRARFGKLLTYEKAIGTLVAYYFNESGKLISSDTDYAIQVPLPLLRSCKNVVGVCCANISPRSLLGALHTGLFTHLVIREQLALELLKLKEEK